MICRKWYDDEPEKRTHDHGQGEAFGILLIRNPDLDPERIARTRELMNAAILDVLVTGYERLIGLVELPTRTIGTCWRRP